MEKNPVVLLILVISFTGVRSATSFNKTGKMFQIFSTVRLNNESCSFQDGINIRNGVCVTADDCEQRKGSPYSQCASGFGVCCSFFVNTCNGIAMQNLTYLRNPGFPQTYKALLACNYLIKKVNPSICTLRLDFERFTILGPSLTRESDDGNTCAPNLDSFSITLLGTGNTNNSMIPSICGENGGQHMYLDVGDRDADEAALVFEFRQEINMRLWEIKVTQYDCFSSLAPPSGCLQYFTGISGRIMTFNFLAPMSGHLGDQDYTACIRQERGHCCNSYTVCPEHYYSFTIGGTSEPSATDNKCYSDYVAIENSGFSCHSSTLYQRYCSSIGILSFLKMGASQTHSSVCACSAPFRVGISTDKTNNFDTKSVQRGICLDYVQQSCGYLRN